jgi:thioredoxin reductase (NADPH)
MDSYDVVIAGGGLAGLTAGLVAARHGLATLVLVAGVPGGHLTSIERIEDFPGFPDGVAGYELCPAVQEQAANQGAEFRMAEVQALAAAGADWLVSASDGEYRARAVIVATGARPRALGIPGEERLRGRGVSHCASCDGPLYRGRAVGVVGGGDSALQEALTLASYAERVWLFHRRAALSGQQTYQRRVLADARIAVQFNTVVEEVLGDEAVTGVRTRDVTTGAEARVDLAGLFIYAGLEPNTAFLRGLLPLDETGRVPTDAWMRTARPGLFAAGDVRRDAAGQAITAAGDGATAAIAAHRYLTGRA